MSHPFLHLADYMNAGHIDVMRDATNRLAALVPEITAAVESAKPGVEAHYRVLHALNGEHGIPDEVYEAVQLLDGFKALWDVCDVIREAAGEVDRDSIRIEDEQSVAS